MREDREQTSVKRKIRFRSPLETFMFIQEFLRKPSFLAPFCLSRSALRRVGRKGVVWKSVLGVSVWKVHVKIM